MLPPFHGAAARAAGFERCSVSQIRAMQHRGSAPTPLCTWGSFPQGKFQDVKLVRQRVPGVGTWGVGDQAGFSESLHPFNSRTQALVPSPPARPTGSPWSLRPCAPTLAPSLEEGGWCRLQWGPLWGSETHSSSYALEGTSSGELLGFGQALPGPHFAHLQIGEAGFTGLFPFTWSLSAAPL